ncbi:MAG TPA: hypothetical protein VGE69_11570 [Pseudomonadales bacterium]
MADNDAQDRRAARVTGIALLVLVLVVIGVAALFLPALGDFVNTGLNPGVDLKGAALASFIVTVILFVVFAAVSGDGLIGELQFMLAGFFSFFAILTFLIAWIF